MVGRWAQGGRRHPLKGCNRTHSGGTITKGVRAGWPAARWTMLSAERNRQLTQVGPGTPMGELLRRYWMPVAGATEFDSATIKAVRLLGEDLVLYKDLGGRFGLVARQCCHRRADLSYGFVESCGIRCNYHGWLYDEQGRCIEQPYEDVAHPEVRLKDQVKLTAYPV